MPTRAPQSSCPLLSITLPTGQLNCFWTLTFYFSGKVSRKKGRTQCTCVRLITHCGQTTIESDNRIRQSKMSPSWVDVSISSSLERPKKKMALSHQQDDERPFDEHRWRRHTKPIGGVQNQARKMWETYPNRSGRRCATGSCRPKTSQRPTYRGRTLYIQYQ